MEAMTEILAGIADTKAAPSYSQEEYMKQRCADANSVQGSLHEEDGHDCPTCKNRGYYEIVKEEYGSWNAYMRMCECQKVRKVLRNIKRSGIKNTSGISFANYQTEHPWQVVIKTKAEAYAADPRGAWFFMGGQTGCGKTFICTAIALELMKQGKALHYMLWRDEAVRLKAAVVDAPAEYEKAVQSLKQVEVLYIDDLFKMGNGEKPTRGDLNLAFEILNHRYNSEKLTIISTEYTIDGLVDIEEAIGGRIAERTRGEYAISIRKDRRKNYRLKGMIQL